MAVKIIGTIIGALILIAGLYYLKIEKNDAESKKIYTIVSVIGGVVFAVMLVLTILAIKG
jgi:uncharacterized membrane protein